MIKRGLSGKLNCTSILHNALPREYRRGRCRTTKRLADPGELLDWTHFYLIFQSCRNFVIFTPALTITKGKHLNNFLGGGILTKRAVHDKGLANDIAGTRFPSSVPKTFKLVVNFWTIQNRSMDHFRFNSSWAILVLLNFGTSEELSINCYSKTLE